MASKTNEITIPDTLKLTEDDKNSPELLEFLAKREAKRKAEENREKLPKIVEFASKQLGEEFGSFDALVSYVRTVIEGRAERKKGKNAPRLTAEQKKKIKDLKAAGKSAGEIADQIGCRNNQVYNALKSS